MKAYKVTYRDNPESISSKTAVVAGASMMDALNTISNTVQVVAVEEVGPMHGHQRVSGNKINARTDFRAPGDKVVTLSLVNVPSASVDVTAADLKEWLNKLERPPEIRVAEPEEKKE